MKAYITLKVDVPVTYVEGLGISMDLLKRDLEFYLTKTFFEKVCVTEIAQLLKEK